MIEVKIYAVFSEMSFKGITIIFRRVVLYFPIYSKLDNIFLNTNEGIINDKPYFMFVNT